MNAGGRFLAAALAALSLGALASIAGAPAASAYDENNLGVGYLATGTDAECHSSGSPLYDGMVSWSSARQACLVEDSEDGTVFRRQAKGVAIKLTVSDGAGMLAKLEFHPYGDEAWIYDTRNDGDTIYFQAYIKPPGSSTWIRKLGFTTAPGTSARVEYTKISLDLAEGTQVSWSAADDSAGNQPIPLWSTLAGPAVYTITGVA